MGKNKTKYSMILTTLVILTILGGCVGNDNDIDEPDLTPGEDNDRKPDEGKFIYGNATVQDIDIVILESFPVQVHVNARGYLPDGCTGIDEIIKSRSGNLFSITITTKRQADAICTQALVPFEEVIPLDVVGLKAGVYDVNVNGVRDSFELAVDNVIQTPE